MTRGVEGKGRGVGRADPRHEQGYEYAMSKVMSIKEAVGQFVSDGAVVGLGGQNIGRCAMAAVHEIIRQGKGDLTLVGCNCPSPWTSWWERASSGVAKAGAATWSVSEPHSAGGDSSRAVRSR